VGEEREIFTSAEEIGILSEEAITKSLVEETAISREVAEEIAREVINEVRKLDLKFISGPLVREITCVKLLERGLEEERKKYTRLGKPVYDVAKLIFSRNHENANTFYNPEFIHKELAGSIAKEYAFLHLLPPDVVREHMSGTIHIHTLEYFLDRPFCFEHNIQYFLRKGVVTDGTGTFVAVPHPPKHLDAAMMQLAKVLQASQLVFSGGQGFDNFNVILAPYARGESYEEIKQAVQYFIFELDTMNFSRGGQTAFTNISLEFEVPQYLNELPVVLPGGKVSREVSYSDFQEEAQQILKAFIEVSMKGDALGKPFHFPKLEFKLRKNSFKNPLFLEVSKLVCKYGTPYFLNLCAPYMPEVVQSQCCRYFLIPSSKQMQRLKEGKLRFGSLQVVSINLPRLSYLSRDEDVFLERIQNTFELCDKVFEAKRKSLRKFIERGASPFLTMDFDGEPYFILEEQSNTIGFVGLNEAVWKLSGKQLHEDRSAWKLGLRIVRFMRDLVEERSRTTGIEHGLVQTPAESTAHRFALLDLKYFGDKSLVRGDRQSRAVYYTNSSHVYVGAEIALWEKIRIESSFHPLVKGGAITHIWLGENSPDPEAISSLIQRIATKSLCSYFAFTRDFTICKNCRQFFSGIHNSCPSCKGMNVEAYSRITGYIVPISAWNAGKLQELKERRRYAL